MNTNETQNDDQNEQNDQLTDLEPQDEVKGGGGARISKIIVDNDAPIAGLDSRSGSGVFK